MSNAIATLLLDHFWPHIARGITAGLPQWYKDELAKVAFDMSSAQADDDGMVLAEADDELRRTTKIE